MRGPIAIFGICVAVLSACGADSDDGSDDTAKRAQVRVVQAVVDAPTLEVYVLASARLPAFPNLASGGASGYVGLDQDSAYQFIVRQPGAPDILGQLDVGLAEGDRKLLLISGARTPAAGEQPITMTMFDDARTEPGPDKTHLRLVNATVDGAPFDAAFRAFRPNEDGKIELTDVQLDDLAANATADEIILGNHAQPISIADTRFALPAFAAASDVTVAVVGTASSEDDTARALRLFQVPAISPGNTTLVTTIAQNPFAIFVNGVPSGAGNFAIDGVAQPTLAFSAVTPRVQVLATPRITLDGKTATLSGSLDAAATYLIVIAPDPNTGGITMFAYHDALADSLETRVRAINATVGSGARDIAFTPAPPLGSDLVVGAASPSTGTLIADPTTITAITATSPVRAPFVYTTGIAASARYVVLVGDTATAFGAVIVAADWSATFVAAD